MTGPSATMKQIPLLRALRSPYLLMVLAMLCWAGNWLLGRALRAEITPIGVNFWRWTAALVILLPFALPRVPAAWPLLRARWGILLVLALLGVTVFQPVVYQALQYTTAINAAIFNSSGPIVIVCISWLMYRDTITLRQGLGIVLSLLGVLAIVTRGELGVLLRLRFNPGDLWALLSVPIWGLYTVLLRRRPAELDGLVFLLALTVLGLVLLAPAYALDLAAGHRMAFTPATVATVVYMGLFASVLGVLFWNSAVPQVGANKAGLYLHLHPAFTTVLAMAFLGERLHAFHLAGIACIALGIYLTSSARTPQAVAPSAAS
jgi:drug/metabolite transporter (DMT)-like permease